MLYHCLCYNTYYFSVPPDDIPKRFPNSYRMTLGNTTISLCLQTTSPSGSQTPKGGPWDLHRTTSQDQRISWCLASSSWTPSSPSQPLGCSVKWDKGTRRTRCLGTNRNFRLGPPHGHSKEDRWRSQDHFRLDSVEPVYQPSEVPFSTHQEHPDQYTVSAQFFSKLDLQCGYFQIPLHEDSRSLTTMITPLGLRQYKRMPRR